MEYAARGGGPTDRAGRIDAGTCVYDSSGVLPVGQGAVLGGEREYL